MHYRENRSSHIGNIAQLRGDVTRSSQVKINNFPDPGTHCIYWYWWEFYPEYGWIAVDFLYSTGCEGSGGSGGGGGGEPDPTKVHCGEFTDDDIADMVAGATLEDVNAVSHNNGPSTTDANGRITKPSTPTWTVMECLLGATGKYFFTASYSGVKFRTGAQDPSWKWQSFQYSGFAGTWEKVACTIQIIINSISHAESRKDDFVYDVALSFSATVKTSIPIIPSSKESWTVSASNKTFSFDATY